MSVLIYLISSFILSWQSSCELEGELEIDAFDNVYVFSNNMLSKYDKSGELTYVYSALSNGDMSSVDVSNPLRISLFFEDNNEILFLDNTLSQQGNSIELNDLDYYDVSLICNSYQNHLWLYRSAEKKLVRISNTGVVTNASENVTSWLNTKDEVVFVQMRESGNHLFLVTSRGEVLIFDQYGTFVHKTLLDFQGHLHFQNGDIIYRQNRELKTYNVSLRLESTLAKLNDSDLDKDQVIMDQTSKKIAVLKGGMLSLYTIEND